MNDSLFNFMKMHFGDNFFPSFFLAENEIHAKGVSHYGYKVSSEALIANKKWFHALVA